MGAHSGVSKLLKHELATDPISLLTKHIVGIVSICPLYSVADIAATSQLKNKSFLSFQFYAIGLGFELKQILQK